MAPPLAADQLLEREFLEMRAKVLQLAASFDRLDRAEGGLGPDPRLEKLRRALAIVIDREPGRAEQVQLVFSRVYDPQWRTAERLDTRR